MSYPTPLGPWFIVQRLRYDDVDKLLGMEYYQSSEDGDEMWVTNKKQALIFSSLQHASRVASSENAEVRVLSSRDEAKEFGHG